MSTLRLLGIAVLSAGLLCGCNHAPDAANMQDPGSPTPASGATNAPAATVEREQKNPDDGTWFWKPSPPPSDVAAPQTAH